MGRPKKEYTDEELAEKKLREDESRRERQRRYYQKHPENQKAKNARYWARKLGIELPTNDNA